MQNLLGKVLSACVCTHEYEYSKRGEIQQGNKSPSINSDYELSYLWWLPELLPGQFFNIRFMVIGEYVYLTKSVMRHIYPICKCKLFLLSAITNDPYQITVCVVLLPKFHCKYQGIQTKLGGTDIYNHKA